MFDCECDSLSHTQCAVSKWTQPTQTHTEHINYHLEVSIITTNIFDNIKV